MGTYLKGLNESYPMNTNMTGFRWFSKNFHACALDENSLSIRRVKEHDTAPSIPMLQVIPKSGAPTDVHNISAEIE